MATVSETRSLLTEANAFRYYLVQEVPESINNEATQ